MQPIKYLFPVLATLLSGCIDQEPMDCRSGVYLHYYYDMNPEYENLFGKEVDELAIFAFDSKGILYDYYRVDDPAQLGNDNRIYLPLPDGEWQIVTWASGQKDGSAQRYYGMGTVNPDEPENPYNYGVVKGETSIEEMRLWIKKHTDSDDGHKLVTSDLPTLYHGDISNVVTKTSTDPVPTIDVPMIRNSNTLRVIINGLPATGLKAVAAWFSIIADMKNGRYTHDNRVGRYAQPVYYRNGTWSINAGDKSSMQYDLSVLRVFADDNISTLTVSSPLLADYGIAGGALVIPIIPTVMENPAYRTQAALDRENLYNFIITLNPPGANVNRPGITITINGWDVVYVSPGIS